MKAAELIQRLNSTLAEREQFGKRFSEHLTGFDQLMKTLEETRQTHVALMAEHAKGQETIAAIMREIQSRFQDDDDLPDCDPADWWKK